MRHHGRQAGHQCVLLVSAAGHPRVQALGAQVGGPVRVEPAQRIPREVAEALEEDLGRVPRPAVAVAAYDGTNVKIATVVINDQTSKGSFAAGSKPILATSG